MPWDENTANLTPYEIDKNVEEQRKANLQDYAKNISNLESKKESLEIQIDKLQETLDQAFSGRAKDMDKREREIATYRKEAESVIAQAIDSRREAEKKNENLNKQQDNFNIFIKSESERLHALDDDLKKRNFDFNERLAEEEKRKADWLAEQKEAESALLLINDAIKNAKSSLERSNQQIKDSGEQMKIFQAKLADYDEKMMSLKTLENQLDEHSQTLDKEQKQLIEDQKTLANTQATFEAEKAALTNESKKISDDNQMKMLELRAWQEKLNAQERRVNDQVKALESLKTAVTQ